MKIIDLPRQGGKTKRLVELMEADDKIVFVAPTLQQAQVAMSYFDAETRPDRNRFVSVSQILSRSRYFPPDAKFVVDEADVVIRMLLGRAVEAIALTGEGQ